MSKYMNSWPWTLIKNAHHTAPSWNEAFAASVVRVMTIIHTASLHCLVVCLATHTWDLKEGKAIVFNHPQGEIWLETCAEMINGSCRQAKHSIQAPLTLHLCPVLLTPAFMRAYCKYEITVQHNVISEHHQFPMWKKQHLQLRKTGNVI